MRFAALGEAGRAKGVVLGAMALAGIALGTGAFVLYDFASSRPSEVADPVVFDVEPGLSFKAAAKRLEAERLVTSAPKFVIYARLFAGGGKVRVGEYAIPRNSTPAEILQIVGSGKSIERPVTVSEGLNIFEVAEIVERTGVGTKADFLALCENRAFIRELLGEDLPSLEGYLFPETYNVTKFTGLKGLVRLMTTRFQDIYKRIEFAPDVKLTRHQLVTLASIVEKETGAPEERPIIASVFHNRLRLGMKLQTDPTVIYGVWESKRTPVKNITRADLTTDTRYNTYVRTGLPFGPIANPGKDALQAAAKPAGSEFLYFVSRNNGTHTFSRDFSAHQKAVQALQVNRAAREAGTSWRDLKTRSQAEAAAHAAELSGSGSAKAGRPAAHAGGAKRPTR